MVKKVILSIAAMMVLVMGVQAQRGFRADISLHGNFGNGISDIDGLEDAINSGIQSGDETKISAKIPSFGIGLCAGYTGRFLLLDANLRLNYGTTIIEGSHNQQFDKLAYLSFGLRILKIGMVELDAKVGYGASFTKFSLKDIQSHLNSCTMIMPLNATIWIGNTNTMRRRFGISFEYMFAVGNFKDVKYDGIGDAANDIFQELKVAPSVMNVALRYQF